jgi:D-alanyl-lipoteichoic acid acyltransferase DltB (MBOAT superfamily)
VTFNSLQYALFLPVVVIGYWLLPSRGSIRSWTKRPAPRWAPDVRQLWLLAASYVFYAAFDWRFAFLLLFTTVVDYSVGLRLEHLPDDRRRARRWTLLVSLGVNLGVLGFFKYFDFFVDQGVELLTKAGLEPATPALRILLPYGISFYTFQSMGYAIDVYRREIGACRDPLDFATFVAFFPQLVAGPISRAKNLLPQIQADRQRPSGDQVLSGLLLILLGLFKKVVIADSLAPAVNATFGSTDPGPALAATGVLAFAIQIYGDFSGYTDMARGTARLLRVELVHNFDQPYLSRNITEFWRRWHISLSTWLRDYLYIPLGGNRGSAAMVYRNLMLTMLLGGLWHGAGWTFVIWGGLHGLYLCIDRARGVRRDLPDGIPALREVPAILVTFALVCFAWIFFRAFSLAEAVNVIGGFVRVDGAPVAWSSVVLVLTMTVAALAIDLVQRKVVHPLRTVAHRPIRSGALVGAALVLIVVFSGGAPVPFIYFQF